MCHESPSTGEHATGRRRLDRSRWHRSVETRQPGTTGVTESLERRAHELDATLRVGKRGVEAVVDELDRQLDDTDLVKAKFLRSARGGAELAEELAAAAGADLYETRGNTAVFRP